MLKEQGVENYEDYEIPKIKSTGTMSTSQDNISRNQILTAAPSSKDMKAFNAFALERYGTIIYYTEDEQSAIALKEKLDILLPEGFRTLDSGDVIRSVSLIFEKTRNSFTQLLIIAGLISAVFGALIIFYILKERTYDIGVYRTRGMTRIKTAVLITGEIFVIATLAFIIASVIYVSSFTHIADYIYNSEAGSLVQENYVTGFFGGHLLDYEAFDVAMEHEFSLSLTPFISFPVTIAFSVVIGIITVLFISRHEPMKTMTEY